MASTFRIADGDWLVDESLGRPMLISGKAKTKQDFNELLAIEVQPYGFGAGIVDLIGQVPDNLLAIPFDVMRLVNDAVTRWIGLQRRQRSILTDEEVIVTLSFNQAVVDQTDQTTIRFRAAITTRAGEEFARSGSIIPTSTPA